LTPFLLALTNCGFLKAAFYQLLSDGEFGELFDQKGDGLFDNEGKRFNKLTETEGIIFVYNACGQLIKGYSMYFESQATAKVSYLTNDHLGSPRVITDQYGQVVSRRDFHPFGEEIPSGTGGCTTAQGHFGSDSIRQKLTGYERDNETDQDFAQARYYKSSHGRFTSTDPIFIQAGMLSDPQRFNLYAYVRNNPNKYVDTDGEILRLSGDLTFLRNMIDQWGGDFKDKISVVDDGTVTFNVKPEDIKGNEAAQFLYDLVNDP
jgi:RHS repeat-associated protein